MDGTHHIVTLNSGWSPETTLRAEDPCHWPGQTTLLAAEQGANSSENPLTCGSAQDDAAG